MRITSVSGAVLRRLTGNPPGHRALNAATRDSRRTTSGRRATAPTWRRPTITVPAAVLLALSGCSGAADESPATGGTRNRGKAASSSDPCGLVPASSVAGILGSANPNEGAVKVTAQRSSVDSSTCTYTWSGKVTLSKTFSITVFDAKLLNSVAGTGERSRIPNVGDEAFQTSGNYYARVGGTAVHLVNLQESDSAATAILREAAKNL